MDWTVASVAALLTALGALAAGIGAFAGLLSTSRWTRQAQSWEAMAAMYPEGSEARAGAQRRRDRCVARLAMRDYLPLEVSAANVGCYFFALLSLAAIGWGAVSSIGDGDFNFVPYAVTSIAAWAAGFACFYYAHGRRLNAYRRACDELGLAVDSWWFVRGKSFA